MMLLATRFDHLPEPVRHTHTDGGFRHQVDAHVTCPDCFGERPARAGCETCGSRGFVVERRSRDPYATDRVSPYGLDETAGERERAHWSAMARLEAQLREPWVTEQDLIAAANEHGYGWERARAEMYARFDYRALDVALELLHGAWPGVAASSARGLRFLATRMPDPIRAPAAVEPVNAAARGRAADPRARGRRDDQIRELVDAGRSYAEIAATVGLSARQLRRILAVADEEAA